ncbi:MAG: ureidoglycolate lyase [Steroidobacteraceae bacterium]|jgi:ureidoglycolate lyase|nr:ureidoglycolate lyase [Steroidobacteraceae bacterium]
MVRSLPLVDATPEAIAPYGALLAAGLGGSRRTRFYDDAVELHDTPAFQSDGDTCLSVATVRPRAPEVRWLERHFKHTQAFLPLNARPYVVVCAPPSSGASGGPDLDAVRAFRFRAGHGFLMHVGTWHEFPFAIDVPVEMVVVLRNETNRDLDAFENGEALGADLEKRAVAQRWGATFRWRAG